MTENPSKSIGSDNQRNDSIADQVLEIPMQQIKGAHFGYRAVDEDVKKIRFG